MSKKPAPQIVILGDSMLDEYRMGNMDSKRSVFVPTALQEAPGGAGNVACNVRAMGAVPLLYSPVGRSRKSLRYRRCLRAAGVSTEHLMFSRHKDISHKVTLMAGAERILRIDYDERSAMPDKEFEDLLTDLFECNTGWSDLIVADYQKGGITQRGFDWLRYLCVQRHIRLYVDSASQWRLDGVFFYKPNRVQLAKVIGERLETLAKIEEAALRLKRRQRITHMAVTMDRDGLFYLDDHNQVKYMASHCLKAVDPCGAGDTLIAALAVGVARGCPVDRAVELANCAAGVACSYPGTYAVPAEKISHWYD